TSAYEKGKIGQLCKVIGIGDVYRRRGFNCRVRGIRQADVTLSGIAVVEVEIEVEPVFSIDQVSRDRHHHLLQPGRLAKPLFSLFKQAGLEYRQRRQVVVVQGDIEARPGGIEPLALRE